MRQSTYSIYRRSAVNKSVLILFITALIIVSVILAKAQDTTLVSHGVGTFDLPTTTYHDFTDDVLHIKGVNPGLTVLKNDDGNMYNIRSVFYTRSIDVDAERGDRVVILDDVTNVANGDLLWISSTTQVETGWGYVESDLIPVLRVNEETGTVVLRHSLNFSYDVSGEGVSVRIYKTRKVLIENVTIQCDAGFFLGDNLVTVVGMEVELRNVVFRNETGDIPDGISIAQCHNIKSTNTEYYGFRYGCLINQSRRVRAYDTYGQDCRHVFTPATWTDDIEIDGMPAYDNLAAMDAHPCFNVTYRNLEVYDTELSNCRAFGVTLENCKIINTDSYVQGFAYIGLATPAQVADEYDFLFAEHPIKLIGVRWEKYDNLGTYNGIAIYWGGDILIKNCYTHSISIHGGGVGDTKCEVIIENCRVGHIDVRGSNLNLSVYNTTIDKNLFPSSIEALDIDGSGRRIFTNCKFLNWTQSDYLIEYLNSAPSELPVFIECQIPFIGELVKTFQTVTDYTLGFIRCKVTVGANLHARLSAKSYFPDSIMNYVPPT